MIGIVIAMESELRPYMTADAKKSLIGGKEFYRMRVGQKEAVIVYSGIGKVNAAYATTLLCEHFSPEFIVSTGVSGGLGQSNVLDTVVATACVQHDSDTTALGDPIGLVSTVNKIYFETDAALAEKFRTVLHAKTGVFACGDCFVASQEKTDFIVKTFRAVACDMESGAIAQIAYLRNVPYIAVRCISDGAGDNAALSFTETVEKASVILSDAVKKVLCE